MTSAPVARNRDSSCTDERRPVRREIDVDSTRLDPGQHAILACHHRLDLWRTRQGREHDLTLPGAVSRRCAHLRAPFGELVDRDRRVDRAPPAGGRPRGCSPPSRRPCCRARMNPTVSKMASFAERRPATSGRRSDRYSTHMRTFIRICDQHAKYRIAPVGSQQPERLALAHGAAEPAVVRQRARSTARREPARAESRSRSNMTLDTPSAPAVTYACDRNTNLIVSYIRSHCRPPRGVTTMTTRHRYERRPANGRTTQRAVAVIVALALAAVAGACGRRRR